MAGGEASSHNLHSSTPIVGEGVHGRRVDLEGDSSSESDPNNEYQGDPEYEQSDDELVVEDNAEIHLKGLGKMVVEIDVEDVPLDSSDKEYTREDSSDDGDVSNEDELSKLHKPKRQSKKRKLPDLLEFDVDAEMERSLLKLGLVFSSGKLFKQAVREYAIQNGRDIWFKKNDSHRIDDSSTFVIKTYVGEHRCSRKPHNRFATSKWLSKKYLNEFKSNDKWSTYEEQYAALWDYAEEIKYTNKGSTVEFLTESGDNGRPRFKRMYICFSGLKEGFSAGCRPVIGLDGCHIKGPHPGQLLTAIGIDANNGMYPVAYAVVEIESKDSWSWFLNCLRNDLKIENSNHWTFITDKQKGLKQSLKDLWEEGVPEVEHRHCARHLEKNFIKVYKDKKLKELLWKAAREVSVRRFEGVMEEIKKIDESAFDWLMEAGPQHWSRSHFRTHPKCDILLNNLCETFNGTRAILAARDRPILSMLERIRMYLLQRLTKNRHAVLMWNSSIAPRIQDIIEKNKDIAGSHLPIKSSNFIYQITTMYGSLYYVDLKQMKCSCRKWELTSIPCSHAVAAIWQRREDPETYVSKWYMKEYYLKAYSQQIFPIRNQDEWPITGNVGLIKPISKIQLGRPKRSRKLELDEMFPRTGSKMKRRYITIKCSGCGVTGHNFRMCARNKEKNSDINPDVAQHTSTDSTIPFTNTNQI
ncbi:uncharacterized protein LOC133824026 [Humulus lupulus]|uniref:uncharacterized protein LOC133824026 n=1 Tax=Humulus lupulus TaxID=3486 RepID=UPI002B402533|nr:uncharacterized protein LOC133824026 [Humulus lupulus]